MFCRWVDSGIGKDRNSCKIIKFVIKEGMPGSKMKFDIALEEAGAIVQSNLSVRRSFFVVQFLPVFVGHLYGLFCFGIKIISSVLAKI